MKHLSLARTQIQRHMSPRSARHALRILVSALALVSVLTPVAKGASKGEFHVSCDFSHAAMDDPIVFPDQPGVSHLHQFFGNESTDAFSTYATMNTATTTCSFAADRSGYWVPALVTPSGAVVIPKSMTAYYLAPTKVSAPPKNLRIVAGGDTSRLRIAGYACGGGSATSSSPEDCGSDLVKGVIVFPSCWDGRRLDSPDHRSHMAYPTGRGCPGRHPVRIPKIVFHVTYGIHDGRGFALSSDLMMGMQHGMSLHADFFNAWDQAELERQVAGCLNAGKSCDLED